MPTKREREYYAAGYRDGISEGRRQVAIEEFGERAVGPRYPAGVQPFLEDPVTKGFTKKRKLSAWNKFVKANSKKPRFRMRSGKLNLKKMAVAFRKKRRK